MQEYTSRKLLYGLRVLCLLAAMWGSTLSAQTFVGQMSGSWWDPARSGEGQLITFETAAGRNVAFFAYFTYSSTGQASWLVGNADYQTGAASISIPVVTGSGARFGTAFKASDAQFTPAGTAVLEYVNCTQIRLRYTGADSLTLNLVRLIGPLNGVACPNAPPQASSAMDLQLRPLIQAAGLTGNPTAGRTLPAIADPIPQLGKLLFFSKALSANRDTACASCHHPSLGGADGISLSVGTGAVTPELVGVGRRLSSGTIAVGRNANTFFNVGLYDAGLFWDSRVESLGKFAQRNGAGSGIRTPDSPVGIADSRAGPTLPAAQARFPIVGAAEMRGGGFPGMSDDQVRNHVAARLGNYGAGVGQLDPGQWLARFRTAFNSNGSAEQLITFDNIMLAIAEFQRSATFVDTPWSRYVRGDNGAIGESAKQGAVLFYRNAADGGAQCAQCHKGDFFTDERHHALGFPQVGPGMGDGTPSNDDFGRGRQTQSDSDRYRFRTPSLLNVELTAPYGHAGAYRNLDTVFAHYVVPDDIIAGYLANRDWCRLPQFTGTGNCASSFADVSRNTQAAMAKMRAVRTATPSDAMPVVDPARVPPDTAPHMIAFLSTLTDPCLKDRACYGRWIPNASEAPDSLQLNAVDSTGRPL